MQRLPHEQLSVNVKAYYDHIQAACIYNQPPHDGGIGRRYEPGELEKRQRLAKQQLDCAALYYKCMSNQEQQLALWEVRNLNWEAIK